MIVEKLFFALGCVWLLATWRQSLPVRLGRQAMGLSCMGFAIAVSRGQLGPVGGVVAIVSLMLGTYALALANTVAQQSSGGEA